MQNGTYCTIWESGIEKKNKQMSPLKISRVTKQGFSRRMDKKYQSLNKEYAFLGY